MQLPKQKLGFVFAISIFLLIISTFLNLFVHELSHLLTLLFCNGTFKSFAFGSSSYVGGYVQPQYISIIAMSSLIIPTLMSIILFLFKRFYISIFAMGFAMPNVINASLGLFANWFIKESNVRETYDVALACDFVELPELVVCITILILIVNIILLLLKTKSLYQAK